MFHRKPGNLAFSTHFQKPPMGCNKLLAERERYVWEKYFSPVFHFSNATCINNVRAWMSIKSTFFTKCTYILFVVLLSQHCPLLVPLFSLWINHYLPWCEAKKAWKARQVQSVFYILAFNPDTPIIGLHHMYPLMCFCLHTAKLCLPHGPCRDKKLSDAVYDTFPPNQCGPLSQQGSPQITLAGKPWVWGVCLLRG